MYQTYRLSNGIRVVCEYIEYVHSVSVGVFIKSGSRDEPKELQGISHFIEHMLFKGTVSKSAFDIAERIDTAGGSLNAYTSKEYTCFYAKMLEENIETAVETLADMLRNPLLSDSDVELEKNVVYEEIAMYEDSPEDLVHEILLEAGWGENSGLGSSVLGTHETLEKIGSDTLREYMHKMYVPSNCVISVAGKFDKSLPAMLEKYFGTWENGESISARGDEKYKKGVIVRSRDVEQVHFCIGFPSYATEDLKNYPLLAFNNIFGAAMSSTLFQEVREKRGLVYSIYSYITSFADTGMFVISASMKPNNLGEALKIVFEKAKTAKNVRFDEKKLYKAKQQLKGNYIMGLESASSRMQSIGRGMLLTGRVKTPEEIIEKINGINVQSVHECVNEIMDFDKMSACLIGNTENCTEAFEKYFKRS